MGAMSPSRQPLTYSRHLCSLLRWTASSGPLHNSGFWGIAIGEKTKETVQIDTWNASYASVYLHSNSYHYAMGVDVQLSNNL